MIPKAFYIKLLSIILISCLGVIVYSNTFHCSFHFDDHFFIADNTAIKNIRDLQNIWKFLPCRFLFYLTLALNYHCYHLNVYSYHLVNLGFHIVSAILVWWFVLLTLSTPSMKKEAISEHAHLIALLAGSVFVSHPVQTEGVTYIMQRAASMATMFYLASLCFYIKSRTLQESHPTSGFGRVYYIGALITTIMAMFTKEITITLPLLLLLYEFSFFRTKHYFYWKPLVPFLLTLFIIPVTMYFTHNESINSQEVRGAMQGEATDITSMQYLLTQFRVIVTYIRLLFLPLNQNVDYDYPISYSLFELPTLFSFLFLTGILYLAKRLFLKYRLISFSIFWFFLTLLPESSIFPIKDVIFEHRLYLPIVGYSIFLVSGLYYLLEKSAIRMMVIILVLLITCNSVLTYQRNKIWKDEVTFWDDAILKSPHKVRPYSGRGLFYLDQGNFVLAMSDFNKALEINPNFRDAYINRGTIYYKQNKIPQAIADYNKAIQLNPGLVEGYINRGSAYDKLGDLAQAVSDYTKAIELNPEKSEAYNSRGLVYYKLNKLSESISDFNKAIELSPDQEKAYMDRGSSYAKQENYSQAVSDYSKAIEINPHYAEAYNNLGYAYDKQGDITQALFNFNKAIEINPKYEKAFINRGKIYANQSNFTQALSDFNEAIDIDPALEEAYSNRGLIDVKLNNFAQAILDYNKVIELNPKNVDAYINRGSSYAVQSHFTQAMSDFNKAIELDPGSLEAYNNRGRIFSEQGNVSHAISDYNKAIGIDPNYADAYNNRAVCYYLIKDYDKTWGDVHKAEELRYTVNPEFINALKQASGREN